jgi:hypothetical protein
MKRESIIAIVLGVALGIGVGSFILSQTAQGNTKAIETTTSDLKNNVKSNRPQGKSVTFEISEPKTDTVVSSSSLKIKGKGIKDSLLISQSSAGNKIIKLDKAEFELTMNLVLGENIINVTYYPKDSGSDYREKQLVIYYLPE